MELDDMSEVIEIGLGGLLVWQTVCHPHGDSFGINLVDQSISHDLIGSPCLGLRFGCLHD